MKCQFCERVLGVEDPHEIPVENMEWHLIVLVNKDKHMEIHAPSDNPDVMRLILNGLGSIMGWKVGTIPIEKGISQ